MKHILATVLLVCSLSSHAAVTYFCDTTGVGSDAAGAGLSGNDSNTGATTLAGSTGPKKTPAAFRTWFNAAAPGDQALFCKGGAWDGFSTLTSRANTSSLAAYKANPVVIDSYAPTQFSSSVAPRLNTTTAGCTGNDPGGTCVAFNFYGLNSTRFGGYIVRNVLIHGGDTELTLGAQFNNSAEGITFDGVTITHTGAATWCNNSAANGAPSEIVIKNSTISYILGMGVQSWGCGNVYIGENIFDHVANRGGVTSNQIGGKLYDHAIYASGDEAFPTTNGIDTYGITIRNNTITNSCLNATDMPTQCACAVITGHGKIGSMLIEGNSIIQAPGTSNGLCYGIFISPANNTGDWEYEKQFTVRSNLIVNPGNRGVSARAVIDGTFENNVVIKEDVWDDFYGIYIEQIQKTPVTNNDRVKIRNNSIYVVGTTQESWGIGLLGSGTGHEIANNLIIWGASGPGGTGICFNHGTLSSSAYTFWDNNLCVNYNHWSSNDLVSTFATKAAHTAGFGASSDANGIDGKANSLSTYLAAVPATANNFSMKLKTGAPGIGAGNTAHGARLAFKGYTRTIPPDIGALDRNNP